MLGMQKQLSVDDLKKRLTSLAPGESLRLSSANYIKLFEGQIDCWKGAQFLDSEFGCSIRFMPDGVVTIVKKP
jgi:hypothetical protein